MVGVGQEKILVIKLSALGDFVQALGPMAAIRKHHPNAHITLLTTKGLESFGRDCGYFDDVWIDKRPKAFQFRAVLAFRKKLNAERFFRVYDLQNNDRTSFYLKLFKAQNRPEWFGAAKGASHRNIAAQHKAGHAFDRHAQTLALAGIENVELDRLAWMKADVSSFTLSKPYVLLVPGCAPSRPEKLWPYEHYIKVAQHLVEQDTQPVILGTGFEKPIAQSIVTGCPEALDLTGQTSLTQIVSLARDARGAIGNDTGPMHLIAATGCPSLAVFSAHSDIIKHGPKGADVQIIQGDFDLNTLGVERVLQVFDTQLKSAV